MMLWSWGSAGYILVTGYILSRCWWETAGWTVVHFWTRGKQKIELFKMKNYKLLLVFGQIQQPATRIPILIKQKTQTWPTPSSSDPPPAPPPSFPHCCFDLKSSKSPLWSQLDGAVNDKGRLCMYVRDSVPSHRKWKVTEVCFQLQPHKYFPFIWFYLCSSHKQGKVCCFSINGQEKKEGTRIQRSSAKAKNS